MKHTVAPTDPRALLAAIEAKLARDREATPRSWCPHEPTTKQREFLSLDCFEALYGGAAGGGKSDALLMAAVQYVNVPGYAAGIFRRTYADLALPGAIMDRAKEWFIPNGIDWNEKEKTFFFPTSGAPATLTFGYLDTERDRFRYQGAEFQFIGLDELTQLAETWYRYMLSRLRRPKDHGNPLSRVPLRARAASNPGGIGHDWVRRRFVESTDASRKFIPATLADNPHLDADSYRTALAQLDPVTRKQLLEGIWIRDGAGLVYHAFDDARNVVDAVPECEHHVLGIDYGFVDETAFSVVGWNDHDPCVYVVESFKHASMTPSAAAEAVQELRGRYDFTRIVADVGGLGKGYAEEARRRFHLPIEPAEKTNKVGYVRLLNGDLASEPARLVVSRARAAPLVEEWLDLPWNEARTKEAEGFANHCSDATLYAWRACWAFIEKPKPKPPTAEEAIHAETEAMWEREAAEIERAKHSVDDAWWER